LGYCPLNKKEINIYNVGLPPDFNLNSNKKKHKKSAVVLPVFQPAGLRIFQD
jgi:hypothetical protein